jgi:hypothetical protein
MGESWKPIGSESSEDVIALISQDGAALRIFDDSNTGLWYYRNFLISSNNAVKLLDKIKKEHERGNENNWPLIAKGSRRWSAAITACHPEVRSVLVISQDGDMQLWRIENESNTYSLMREQIIEVIEFPIDGKKRVLVKMPVRRA